jgi:hypothetical protein
MKLIAQEVTTAWIQSENCWLVLAAKYYACPKNHHPELVEGMFLG